jgi:hypothetical protein
LFARERIEENDQADGDKDADESPDDILRHDVPLATLISA